MQFIRRCARNLKEKARSGSLSEDFDSRIKVNTFIQTNFLVLPVNQNTPKIRNKILIRKSLLCKPTLRKFSLELCPGRGCTRLLLYFNTNKPRSFFWGKNTSCITKPQVMGGGGGAPPAPSP